MALPSVVLPIIAGVAIVAVIASFFAICQPMSQQRTGNSRSRSLPAYEIWSDIKNENEPRRRKKPKKKCPVCLEEIETLSDQDIIIYSLKCGHLICADCIISIQNFHRTSGDTVYPRCPQCRVPFEKTELRRIVW